METQTFCGKECGFLLITLITSSYSYQRTAQQLLFLKVRNAAKHLRKQVQIEYAKTTFWQAPRSRNQRISWSTSFRQSLTFMCRHRSIFVASNNAQWCAFGAKKHGRGWFGLMTAIFLQVVKNEGYPILIDQPAAKGLYETVPDHVPFSWYPLHTQNILNKMNSTCKGIPYRN